MLLLSKMAAACLLLQLTRLTDVRQQRMRGAGSVWPGHRHARHERRRRRGWRRLRTHHVDFGVSLLLVAHLLLVLLVLLLEANALVSVILGSVSGVYLLSGGCVRHRARVVRLSLVNLL